MDTIYTVSLCLVPASRCYLCILASWNHLSFSFSLSQQAPFIGSDSAFFQLGSAIFMPSFCYTLEPQYLLEGSFFLYLVPLFFQMRNSFEDAIELIVSVPLDIELIMLHKI